MDTLDKYPGNIYPSKEKIFEMFELISKPKDVRVIIVGQSPYPDDNACGIPFVSAKGLTTKTLENMRKELKREYPYLHISRDMNNIVRSWVEQGVFMINMAMTTGDGPITDHSVMWEEFVRELIRYIISYKTKKEAAVVPVVLMGSVAWDIGLGNSIKVPHPVARDGSFIGCDVFIKCNNLIPDKPILWVK